MGVRANAWVDYRVPDYRDQAAVVSLLTPSLPQARAVGGTRIVLIPDYDPVHDIALYGGCSLDECIALLRQRWGEPHPATEIVTEDVQVYYRREFPVWYVESLNRDG